MTNKALLKSFTPLLLYSTTYCLPHNTQSFLPSGETSSSPITIDISHGWLNILKTLSCLLKILSLQLSLFLPPPIYNQTSQKQLSVVAPLWHPLPTSQPTANWFPSLAVRVLEISTPLLTKFNGWFYGILRNTLWKTQRYLAIQIFQSELTFFSLNLFFPQFFLSQCMSQKPWQCLPVICTHVSVTRSWYIYLWFSLHLPVSNDITLVQVIITVCNILSPSI